MSEPVNNSAPEEKQNIFGRVYEFFHDLLDLKDGLDKEGTIINIKSNKEMKSANAWLLMCSILIASLGLDLNSPAVIIGAMLISPLMSPILGIGLGIGINDRITMTVSGRHLLIAIGIALVTSTSYFAFSNWLTISGGFTDEISGRTRPSILDAMVALIGGIAGIISSSRKDKSNAIPGVAIATALMPPLCVTGYGIAQGMGYLIGAENVNMNFGSIVFNSFFLFVLNATLVALGTYFIVRFMKFPTRSFASEKEEQRSKMYLIITSLLLIGISVVTTTRIIQENHELNTIENFILDHSVDLRLVEYDIIKDLQSGKYKIDIDALETLTPQECLNYEALLASPEYGIKNAAIKFNYPDEKKLKEISEQSGRDILLIQNTVKGMKGEIDSLTNVIESVLVKNKNEVEGSIRFIARANFPELEEIKCYLPVNEKDPPSLALKWEATAFKKEKLIKLKEEKLKNLVMDLMEFDSILITHF